MTFRPPRRQGILIGLALLAALVALDAVWLGLLRSLPLTALSLLWIALIAASLPALGFVVNSLYRLARLAYVVDRDGLTIHWGASSLILPLAEIERVLTRRDVEPENGAIQAGMASSPRLHLRGLYWPGRLVGPGRAEDFGPAHFYATRPWPHQVLVTRGNAVYVLSPADSDAFAAALLATRAAGPAQESAVRRAGPPLAHRLDAAWRRFAQDRVATGLLGAGIGLNALLFFYLAWRYPSLPPAIPLHFDPAGVPDMMTPPSQAFILPLIGLMTFSLNTLLGWGLHVRQDRSPAYLLWGSTVLVQILLWVATLSVVSGQWSVVR